MPINVNELQKVLAVMKSTRITTADAISAAGRKHGVPVGFGVLTVDTIEQAIERAGTKAGNKGEEATLAVIEMVNTLRRLD